MKKIASFFVAILWFSLIALSVSAGTVNELDVSATTTSLTVSGSAADINAAVVVQILDQNNNVLGMESFPVLDDAFSGTVSGITLVAGDSYTVRVADFDGGSWKKTVVTAVAPTPTPTPTPTPPTTTVSNTKQTQTTKNRE